MCLEVGKIYGEIGECPQHWGGQRVRRTIKLILELPAIYSVSSTVKITSTRLHKDPFTQTYPLQWVFRGVTRGKVGPLGFPFGVVSVGPCYGTPSRTPPAGKTP